MVEVCLDRPFWRQMPIPDRRATISLMKAGTQMNSASGQNT